MDHPSQPLQKGIITLESPSKKRSFQFCEFLSFGVPKECVPELWRPLLNGQIQLPSLNGCCCSFRFTDSCSPQHGNPHARSLSWNAHYRQLSQITTISKCLGEYVQGSGISINFLFQTCVPSWNIYLRLISKLWLVFIDSKSALT